jgi:hypothetical protein
MQANDRADFRHWKMMYAGEEGQVQNGFIVTRLVRTERDKSSPEHCFSVPMLELSNVIYESHSINLGYLGEERKYTNGAKKHHSVSQGMV